MSIKVEKLTKIYGTQKALDEVSLEINQGEIVGLLGPNGAGKSTLMKIITGYLPASDGKVSVMGMDVVENPLQTKRLIGYLPESNPLYYEMYVREFLAFTAGLFKIKNAKDRIEEVIELTGLGKEAHKKIGALSKGYKQRVGLAQAFIHDPKVLILDEPTSGLDPNQLIEIRNLIRKIGQDKTVLFSSHIMQEVEAICDRILIINNGKLIADSPKNQMQKLWKNKEVIVVEFKETLSESILKKISEVEKVQALSDHKFKLTVEAENDLRPKIYEWAKEHNYTLIGMQSMEISLENIFQDLTK